MDGFDCVFQPSNEEMVSGTYHMKGRWLMDYFKNSNPITLELGCGKGEYTIALAGMYPNRNFIGIDVKGARLWRGAKTAVQARMGNVAFIRTKIEFINSFFAEAEVEEIWLTFSDPQLRDHKGTKRLSSSLFLGRYARILSPHGTIHLKTDSDFLYHRTLETIAADGHCILTASANVYGADMAIFTAEQREILAVKTFYEQKFLAKGENINYVHFELHDQAYQAQREE